MALITSIFYVVANINFAYYLVSAQSFTASPSSSWQNTTISSSHETRIQLASDALDVALSHITNSNGIFNSK
ncbi:hypothetical protein VKT23_014197 [Stygiomarasmius scandens]|uniref:Uncharacterized protein n=1 Tax=Marasmiellus scandens TaxID=2682957 RepID=A0ABR1J5M9_9AGAR